MQAWPYIISWCFWKWTSFSECCRISKRTFRRPWTSSALCSYTITKRNCLAYISPHIEDQLKLGCNILISWKIVSGRNFKRTSTKNQTVLEDLEQGFPRRNGTFRRSCMSWRKGRGLGSSSEACPGNRRRERSIHFPQGSFSLLDQQTSNNFTSLPANWRRSDYRWDWPNEDPFLLPASAALQVTLISLWARQAKRYPLHREEAGSPWKAGIGGRRASLAFQGKINR